jgi:hypothetical protein
LDICGEIADTTTQSVVLGVFVAKIYLCFLFYPQFNGVYQIFNESDGFESCSILFSCPQALASRSRFGEARQGRLLLFGFEESMS